MKKFAEKILNHSDFEDHQQDRKFQETRVFYSSDDLVQFKEYKKYFFLNQLFLMHLIFLADRDQMLFDFALFQLLKTTLLVHDRHLDLVRLELHTDHRGEGGYCQLYGLITIVGGLFLQLFLQIVRDLDRFYADRASCV